MAFYCLIHLDDGGLAATAHELARVVARGGPLLAEFHTGREVRQLDTWWDHEVDLDFRFLEREQVVGLLEPAGFDVEAVLDRAPHPEDAATHRTYVLARRRASSSVSRGGG